MQITEYEIYAFILGAGAGSIVTYYITTRDKRAIAEVSPVHSMLLGAQKKLAPSQSAKTRLSDAQILEMYGWAQGIRTGMGLERPRPHPATLAALRIICKELLGLTDAA
jgi:hypothetical protein